MLPVPSPLPCCGAPPRLWSCENGCCPKCQPGAPLPQELVLLCSPCPKPEVGPKPKATEVPPNPSLFSALCCSQKAWEMGPQVSELLAPWAWRAARRGSQGQEQEKAGSSRQSTGGFGECPGQGWGDLRSRPALPLLGPGPWAPRQDSVSRLSYPICKMKAFPAPEHCISFK